MAFRVGNKYAYRNYNNVNRTLANLGRMNTRTFTQALAELIQTLKDDAFEADCENADRIHGVEKSVDALTEIAKKLADANSDLHDQIKNLHSRLDRAGIAR